MDYTTITLPKPLANKVKELIEGTGFSSVSSFVVYVMRQLVAEGSGSFDKEAEKKIRARLRALGYLK